MAVSKDFAQRTCEKLGVSADDPRLDRSSEWALLSTASSIMVDPQWQPRKGAPGGPSEDEEATDGLTLGDWFAAMTAEESRLATKITQIEGRIAPEELRERIEKQLGKRTTGDSSIRLGPLPGEGEEDG